MRRKPASKSKPSAKPKRKTARTTRSATNKPAPKQPPAPQPATTQPVVALTWAAWNGAKPAQRTAWLKEAAKRVGGTVKGTTIVVKGVTLVLVPGGQVELGWNGATTTLDAKRRAHWDTNADFGRPFETFLRPYLGLQRSVSIRPFLIEPVATAIGELDVDPYDDDPKQTLRATVTEQGFRLPTNDEWEVAMRAGATTMFPWGDDWPDGAPGGSTAFDGVGKLNALAIAPRTSTYDTEVVEENSCLRGGDGGTAVCGGRPSPEAWYSFALAFQWPRDHWEDVVSETFEQAFVRRTLSL